MLRKQCLEKCDKTADDTAPQTWANRTRVGASFSWLLLDNNRTPPQYRRYPRKFADKRLMYKRERVVSDNSPRTLLTCPCIFPLREILASHPISVHLSVNCLMRLDLTISKPSIWLLRFANLPYRFGSSWRDHESSQLFVCLFLKRDCRIRLHWGVRMSWRYLWQPILFGRLSILDAKSGQLMNLACVPHSS